jgi:protein SFI1
MSSGRRSSPQDAGNQSPASIEPFYTNEDIALLHDIVVLAQELLPHLPERERLPTNALFSAYDDILPRIGVNADHDSRYARILFKIGGLRGGGTLYEKLEEVLSRMGIEIEFDEVEEDSDDQHESAPAILEDTEAYDMLQDENVPPRGRRRRNSDSAWDLVLKTPAKSQSRRRRNSYSSVNKARASPIADRQGFLREVLQQQPSNQLPRDHHDVPGSNVGAWLKASQAPPRKERGRSISTQRGMLIRRRSISVATGRLAPTTTTSNANSDEYHAESEITAVTSTHEAEVTEPIDVPHRQRSNKPSARLMQTKAEVILQLHLSYLAKQQLRTWRNKALQRRQDHAKLDLVAYQHDKSALLYQALETWRSRYREKRSIEETERFFAHLERRTVFARNNYLKLKVFTHWHVCAREEAERTRAAQRHILRTRMFNAWRDITVVKELKVRRHVLKKFFGVWQGKHTAARSNDTTGLQVYRGNLVEKVFKQWVRKMWVIKANTWWSDGVKQRTLSLWRLAARNALDQHRTAEDERLLQLAWNAWRIWQYRSRKHVEQEQQAVTFDQAYICLSAIRKWRGETKVIPAKKTLQTEVATRILRDAFRIWLQRARLERQARTIDRTRILREAWTNWRHKYRLQLIRFHTGERLVYESFVKWMLERRASTIRRFLNGKLLHKALEHWANRAQESRHKRWNQENLAQQFAVQKRQRLVVKHWSVRSQCQLQLDHHATELHASRLLQRVLSKWPEKLPHLRQLQHWSRDAEFYFLTSKTLKRWKASTESSKREKRKVAYAQVRRTTKMNLGRAILLGWRIKAQKVLDMQAQVEEIIRNKTVVVGMDIFDRWRARTEELGEIETIWRQRLLRKFFDTWKDRSLAFQDLNTEAVISSQERQQSRAIKKWELVMLQMRGRGIQAAEVQEKNAKRTFRKMFNYWSQKAAERRPVKYFEDSEAGRPTQLGGTARAEAWSDFGDEEGEWAKGPDEVAHSTPLRGYLSTPSKGKGRVVAAAAKFSSTTPKAPLPTYLRAQYSGGILPSLRKGPGRSTLRDFPDIDDKSTKDHRGKS